MSLLWLVLAIFPTIWAAVLTVAFFKLKREITQLKISHPLSGGIKHWSFVKFNPFSETGGQYSFVITLLDGLKNGIIITSLHGRGVTRFYAKQVVAGSPDQDLSDEERQGLLKAINS